MKKLTKKSIIMIVLIVILGVLVLIPGKIESRTLTGASFEFAGLPGCDCQNKLVVNCLCKVDN